MRALFKFSKNVFELITNSWFNIMFFLGLSLFISYWAINFNQGLPKPETIIELGKFYLQSPGPYFKGTLFNIASGILWITIGSSFIFEIIKNNNEYPTWFKVIFITFSLLFIFISFYFFGYFLLLLITLAIIGLVGYFILLALGDNRSYR